MTREQKYHRRLARKYGKDIFLYAAAQDCSEYRGKFSAYWYAKQAAWHAFKAHPELRDPGASCT